MTPYTVESPDGKERLTIDAGFRSPITDAHAGRLVAAIKENCKPPPVEYPVIELLSWMITTTRRMEFEGVTSDPMRRFEWFWAWLWNHVIIQKSEGGVMVNGGLINDAAGLSEAYPLFNEHVSNRIQEIWYAAFEQGQLLFPASPLIAPESTLTKEQQGDPDFLARGGQREKPLDSGRGRKPKPTPVRT